MKQKYKLILVDIKKLINEFLREEISIKDVRTWINTHPECKKNKEKCNRDCQFIQITLSKVNNLTYCVININQWLKINQEIDKFLK